MRTAEKISETRTDAIQGASEDMRQHPRNVTLERQLGRRCTHLPCLHVCFLYAAESKLLGRSTRSFRTHTAHGEFIAPPGGGHVSGKGLSQQDGPAGGLVWLSGLSLRFPGQIREPRPHGQSAMAPLALISGDMNHPPRSGSLTDDAIRPSRCR